MVAAGEEAEGAVGGGEGDAAGGADGEGEEAVAAVIVEGGYEGVAAGCQGAPESEEGTEPGGAGAGEEGAVVGGDGVDPGVEAEDGEDGGAADPIELMAGEVKLVGGGDEHDDVADGTELEEEDAGHAGEKDSARGGRGG